MTKLAKKEVVHCVGMQPKKPFDWTGALARVAEDHWRTLRVTIKLRDRMCGGKPALLDAANAMLRARDLDDQIEPIPASGPEREAEASDVADYAGLCEFHRREEKPGIWFPTNNLKAALKENWSVLGLRVSNRGSRGALAEGVFVYSIQPNGTPRNELDWIYLGEKPHGVLEAVTHSMTPRGPISSIKRNEFVSKITFRFDIAITKAISEKLPDEDMARTLVHMSEHGIGANRSQGFGKFDLVSVEEQG